jgi:hypothetical protein
MGGLVCSLGQIFRSTVAASLCIVRRPVDRSTRVRNCLPWDDSAQHERLLYREPHTLFRAAAAS